MGTPKGIARIDEGRGPERVDGGHHPPSEFGALVKWMNKHHAVVREGGKTHVITEERDPIFGRRVLTRSSFADFKRFYMNTLIPLSASRPGQQPRTETAGKVWLEHPDRRQFSGVVFAPQGAAADYLNLWTGFAVEPKRGNWSSFDRHIRLNLCHGSDDLYRYVRAWMAHAVQHPEQPAESALVLRGPQGSGKGIFARTFASLFGPHSIQVSQARHLVGAFNAHLQDAVVVFADEAFAAGDRQAAAVLKTLITEPVIVVERKFQDVVTVKNVVHLIIASNDAWVVPAGLDERRFCVLDVNPRRAQDHDYFGSIVAEMNNGGNAAMLHDLRREDLSRVDLRRPPATKGLVEQKLLSMNPAERWWFERLSDGKLLVADDAWRTEVLGDLLSESYADALHREGERRHTSATALGIFLGRMLPSGYPRRLQRTVRPNDLPPQARFTAVRGRRRFWGIPDLGECRAAFDTRTRTEWPWP
jgi:hypothetical protein